MQTIPELADKVQSAVKLGDALGKTEQEIHADVHSLVGHLPVAVLDEIGQHITATVAADNQDDDLGEPISEADLR